MNKSLCVWIIDDDRSIRWVLEKALLRENIPCVTFSAASAALSELDQSQPSAVLSLPVPDSPLINTVVCDCASRPMARNTSCIAGGRRIEAAHLLGWGRNTLTRKIHELGMVTESLVEETDL